MDSKMTEFYQELLLILMPRIYINSVPIETIDPTDVANYRNIKEMYLGLGVLKQLLLAENSETILEFKRKCRQFTIKACMGIRKRYSTNNKVLRQIAKLSPVNCMSDVREETLANIFVLLPRFAPESVQQELDDEWRKLPSYLKQEKIDVYQEPDEFWHKVAQLGKMNEQSYFKELPKGDRNIYIQFWAQYVKT